MLRADCRVKSLFCHHLACWLWGTTSSSYDIYAHSSAGHPPCGTQRRLMVCCTGANRRSTAPASCCRVAWGGAPQRGAGSGLLALSAQVSRGQWRWGAGCHWFICPPRLQKAFSLPKVWPPPMHLPGNPPVWSQLLKYFSITAFMIYVVCVNYILMFICQHSSKGGCFLWLAYSRIKRKEVTEWNSVLKR